MKPRAATSPRLAARVRITEKNRLVDWLGLERGARRRVHLAEDAGGRDQDSEKAKDRCDGPVSLGRSTDRGWI
jgi:hypothetical protein